MLLIALGEEKTRRTAENERWPSLTKTMPNILMMGNKMKVMIR